MPVTVTLEINSGRPDPSWTLSVADIRILGQLLARLSAPVELPPPETYTRPGYRGFVLTATGIPNVPAEIRVRSAVVELKAAALHDPARTVELFLRGTARGVLGPGMLRLLDLELARASAPPAPPLMRQGGPRLECDTAPKFTKTGWSGAVRAVNNCYNYANNKKLDAFGHPGFAANRVECPSTCADLTKGAVDDGLIKMATAAVCPLEGHIVALLVRPATVGDEGDFHWARLDRTGLWSHKVGSSAVSKLDSRSEEIPDITQADMTPYTQFCGFFQSIKSQVTICGRSSLNCPG